MAILEVLPTDTPNTGRLVWNTNDRELQQQLRALAINARSAPYNAQGNGRADDRGPIQAAIDACADAGGGYVYLPTGEYLIASGSLLLRDGVNILGAGMYKTTLKLGPGVNRPVITDASVGRAGAYAFGTVRLTDFGIDGNRAENPQGQEGIWSTAYYSTFERLYIRECRTHGLRIGFAELANVAAQTTVSSCRIAHCGDTGVYLDIKSVDHTLSQNYIHNCTYGIVIRNGGVRVVNNDLFGHAIAAIQVTQTAYQVLIIANDINAVRRNAIHISRTNVAGTGPWSQMLVANNAILGDELEADNLYDAIYVETSVPHGIANLTLNSNHIYTLGGNNRFRYGINLETNVVHSVCSANAVYNAGTASYHVGPTCSQIVIDRLGGGILEPPAMPPSGVELTNPYHAPVTVYITGGNVSSIAVGGQSTGITIGAVRLPAGQKLSLTYTDAPTWVWIAD